MNMRKSVGIIVTGLVTGNHFLEDIKVIVPYKVAVTITPEQMLQSKDLYRALQQGTIFKLDGAIGSEPSDSARDAKVAELETTKQNLQQALSQSEAKYGELEQQMQKMQGKLDLILSAVKDRPQQSVGTEGKSKESVSIGSGLVGAEIPLFIPENIKPKDASSNIDVKEEVSKDSDVKSAAKALRKIRRGDS